MVCEIQRRYQWAGPYCYIETNAGSGWNETVQVDGSPLIALRELDERRQLRHHSWFIEKHAPSAEELQRRLDGLGALGQNSRVICGDHVIALPTLLENLPPKAFGLVYADPNKPSETPVEAMRTFLSCPKASMVDVLINVNALALKRVVAAQRKGNPGNYEDLAGVMRRIPKRHWWIREPVDAPGSKWTFLFGSNTDKIKIKGLGRVGLPLFRVESRDGQRILEKLMGESGKPAAHALLTGATESISGTRYFSQFEISPSGEAAEIVSYAVGGLSPKCITASIQGGGLSMSQKR
jgi:three-Cys-motif partner protein